MIMEIVKEMEMEKQKEQTGKIIEHKIGVTWM
jgi:hypothetical protein